MVVSLLSNLYSTLRLISFFLDNGFTSNLSKYISFPSIISRVDAGHAIYFHCRFCAGISRAISSEEAIENKKPKAFKEGFSCYKKLGKFRKYLRISEIKGGPDERLDGMGKTLIVKGWVQTIRVRSRVTFMEVNDGSCVSNMPCVLGPDTESYDQVKSCLITTGAPVWVQGIVVASQGSKQKVELKLQKIVMVDKSDPSYPMQKNGLAKKF